MNSSMAQPSEARARVAFATIKENAHVSMSKRNTARLMPLLSVTGQDSPA